MSASNTRVIYHGISTLEMTGIFITLVVNYHSIWTLEIDGFYRGIFITLDPDYKWPKMINFFALAKKENIDDDPHTYKMEISFKNLQ